MNEETKKLVPEAGPRVQTTIAPPVKVAQTPTLAPPPKPPTVAQLVRGAVPPKIPAGLVSGSTNTILDDSYFRAVLYGVTSAKKTTTAAEFEDPEFTKIILTRDKSQLIPLAGLGYDYVHCDSATKFDFAMRNPEALWPEWAAKSGTKRCTLIVDDITKALDVMVKAATVRDNRMAYRDAKNDLDALVTGLSAKPYNIILISTAKVGETIRDEEQIVPEMSPSMYSYICSEFSAVLYIDATKNQILTDRDKFGIAVEDPSGKVTGTKTRVIFAKHKLPKSLVGKGLINLWEPRDLRAFWKKLKSAQLQAVK